MRRETVVFATVLAKFEESKVIAELETKEAFGEVEALKALIKQLDTDCERECEKQEDPARKEADLCEERLAGLRAVLERCRGPFGSWVRRLLAQEGLITPLPAEDFDDELRAGVSSQFLQKALRVANNRKKALEHRRVRSQLQADAAKEVREFFLRHAKRLRKVVREGAPPNFEADQNNVLSDFERHGQLADDICDAFERVGVFTTRLDGDRRELAITGNPKLLAGCPDEKARKKAVVVENPWQGFEVG